MSEWIFFFLLAGPHKGNFKLSKVGLADKLPADQSEHL